jgi:sorting nexin-15
MQNVRMLMSNVFSVVQVFSKGHPEGVTCITVWKRYNDFKKLFKELQLIHHQLHLFGTFPTFPKGTLFGRFENDIIEERRQAALGLLQFAALYPQLYTSKVFSKFFEVKINCEPVNY